MILRRDPLGSCPDYPVCHSAITTVFHHVPSEFPFGFA